MTRLKILTLIMYVLLIFYLSTRSTLYPPGPDFALKDKLAHFLEYSVLGLLLFRGIGWTVSRSKIPTFLFLFAVGVSVAALDELLQSYVPHRNMDLFDWFADATGVAAGVVVGMAIGLANRRKKTSAARGNTSG